MEDGVHLLYCNRYGCGKLVGAQRFEDNQCVEEEYTEGAVTDEQGHYWCNQECCDNDEVFVTPEEIMANE